MREAVIVATARTPIGRAYRGAFNNTEGPTLGGHAIRHAVERAGLDPAEVEDVNWGYALTQGSQSPNIARLVGHALIEGKRAVSNTWSAPCVLAAVRVQHPCLKWPEPGITP